MRQRIRLILAFVSLLLFPVTLNFFSPYISIDGALAGIVSGSLLVFLIMFISALFFGRAWCSWVCPIAGLSEISTLINRKTVPVKKLTVIRYSIFIIWFSFIITGFILAGGIKGIDPLHLTDGFVSVDEPVKYIVYYIVLSIFFGLNIWLGKRASCHSICWMSPFLVCGYLAGRLIHLPQMRIKSEPSKCTECKTCTGRCPMSIKVDTFIQSGEITSLDCILCGQCIDACPQKVLRYSIRH